MSTMDRLGLRQKFYRREVLVLLACTFRRLRLCWTSGNYFMVVAKMASTGAGKEAPLRSR